MKKELPQDQDLQVQLKPLFGIKPGIYLLGLYTLAAALAAYWLFLEPGIQRPGSLVTFTSTPPGAAVFTVDSRGQERYWGATPVRAFLAEGQYLLEIRKNNFQTTKTELPVGNRVFFSRFLPETREIQLTLEKGDLVGIQQDFDRELSQWALLGPSMSEYAYPALFSITRPKENWVGVSHPLPPLFTQLRQDWTAAGGQLPDLLVFLGQRIHWVADPVLYADLMEALDKKSSEMSFTDQLAFWREKFPQAQGLASWIMINHPYKERNALAQSQDYLSARDQDLNNSPEFQIKDPAPSSRVLSGMSFLGVPGGVYSFGEPNSLSLAPPFGGTRPVEISPFLLGKTEVTQGEFALFVKAVPQWAASRRGQLVEQGLVDEGYLADWTSDNPPSGREDHPVTGVSWYAAQAFASWMETRTPGYSFHLPLEEEWEWAARAGKQDSGWSGENRFRNLKTAEQGSASTLGIRGLSGQVWEWTSSDAAQAASLVALGRQPQIPLSSSGKKTLRGGSFADPKILPWSVRGFYDAAWCTPYAGFRLLARPK